VQKARRHTVMIVGEKKLWPNNTQEYGVADNYDIALSSNKVTEDDLKNYNHMIHKQATGKHSWWYPGGTNNNRKI
jgi:hypothetical protein